MYREAMKHQGERDFGNNVTEVERVTGNSRAYSIDRAGKCVADMENLVEPENRPRDATPLALCIANMENHTGDRSDATRAVLGRLVTCPPVRGKIGLTFGGVVGILAGV